MISVKNIVMGIAIFILTLSVGIYGINTLYGKGPDWEKFCPHVTEYATCLEKGGRWVNQSNPSGSINIPAEPTKQITEDIGYCDFYPKCSEDYEVAREKYSRNIFFIALPLGIIIIAIGALIFGLEAVGGGLMAGGVGIIMFGVGSVWQYADDWLKFILSLLGLVAVIWITYYWNNRIKGKHHNH